MNTRYSETVKKKAYTLRAKGMTYRGIGDKLQVHFITVYKWIEAEAIRNPLTAKRFKSKYRTIK